MSAAIRRSPVAFADAEPAETELRRGWRFVLRYESEDADAGPLAVDLSHLRRWDFQSSRLDAGGGARLDEEAAAELPVPERPGGVARLGPFVVCRMNRTQLAIWRLGEEGVAMRGRDAEEPHRANADRPGGRRAARPEGERAARPGEPEADGSLVLKVPEASSGCTPGDRPEARGALDGAPAPAPDSRLTELTDGHCALAFVGARVPDLMERLTPLDLFDPSLRPPFLTQGPVLGVPCQIVTFASELVALTLERGYGERFAAVALSRGEELGLRPGGESAFRAAFARLGKSG